MKVSPLAPVAFPDLPRIGGVRFATGNSGTKYKGRDDVMLAELAPGTVVAGVFTTSATRSAPVLDCQSKIGKPSEAGAAIVINAGNANAFTGRHGDGSVQAITTAVSGLLNCPEARVFTCSTGVIGEPLDHGKIVDLLGALSTDLAEGSLEPSARAIMTTDTYAKGAGRSVEIEGKTVSIAGIAKGSGMIAPDMATMLVTIFTDAAISHADLQVLVSAQCDLTFNCITVDSDTSTSDSLLVAATGASGVSVAESVLFNQALHDVMLDLAHQVVKDGEGATKFVEVRVTGAASDADARKVANAIANSPLVKTAIAGEDPNWGRIVMAVGKSGAQANRDTLSIRFGDVLVAEHGWVAETYEEASGAAVMKEQRIPIAVNLGIAGGMATVWTCDLTHDYITINADYRS